MGKQASGKTMLHFQVSKELDRKIAQLAERLKMSKASMCGAMMEEAIRNSEFIVNAITLPITRRVMFAIHENELKVGANWKLKRGEQVFHEDGEKTVFVAGDQVEITGINEESQFVEWKWKAPGKPELEDEGCIYKRFTQEFEPVLK